MRLCATADNSGELLVMVDRPSYSSVRARVRWERKSAEQSGFCASCHDHKIVKSASTFYSQPRHTTFTCSLTSQQSNVGMTMCYTGYRRAHTRSASLINLTPIPWTRSGYHRRQHSRYTCKNVCEVHYRRPASERCERARQCLG